MNKTFAEFINESNEPEQLDEAFAKGTASVVVTSGNSPVSMQGVLVHKTSGGQPNAEFIFDWDPRQGIDYTLNYSKGYFREEKEVNKFNNRIKSIMKYLKEVESGMLTGGGLKILSDTLGVKVKTEQEKR